MPPVGPDEQSARPGDAGRAGEADGQAVSPGPGPLSRVDLVRSAADILEQVAESVRSGELNLPDIGQPHSPQVVLAAVLTSLLVREAGGTRALPSSMMTQA